MSLCKIKLSKEMDLITIVGDLDNDSAGKLYNLIDNTVPGSMGIYRCEAYRNGTEMILLIPTGQLPSLIDTIKEVKKTTPSLTTLIRTGVVMIDLISYDGYRLYRLICDGKLPKPEYISISKDRVQLIAEANDVPLIISVISHIE
ncbi:MAG: hypothetical protein PHE51_04215 [Eubacteriales bacterium]|nr:hypothetical protein [Eubacteriales bacterium]